MVQAQHTARWRERRTSSSARRGRQNEVDSDCMLTERMPRFEAVAAERLPELGVSAGGAPAVLLRFGTDAALVKQRISVAVIAGLGRTAASRRRPSTLHQIR
jgi:hypothetical protein